MARVGRKRKVGARRYPNGQVRHEKVGPTPEWWAHRIAAVGVRNAANWDGSAMHAYALHGLIDDEQQKAGERFERLAAKFYRMQSLAGNQRPKPESAAKIVREAGGTQADVDMADFAEVREAYQRAFESQGDRRAVLAVKSVLQGRPANDVEDLRRGLDGLARHFGLKWR